MQFHPMISAAARWGDLVAPRYAAATATLCLGIALFAFNGFLVATCLPTAVEELGGAALISWSLTLYLAFAIVGGTGAAYAKQRLGGRASLIGAALLVLAGSLVAGLAPDMPTVLVGRVLQGLGEGLVSALCYALIPELFPAALVPKVFGAESLVWAIAAFGGPLLAGVLTQFVSWRAAFLVNVPLAVLFIALASALVPAGKAHAATARVPGLRLGAVGGAVLLLCWAGIARGLLVLALMFAAAGLLIALALRLDGRAREPLLPSAAFSPRGTIGAGLWIVLMMPMAEAAAAVFLAFALQRLWGYNATQAGAANALMAMFWSLTALGVANVASQRRRQSLIGLGPVLLVAGLLGLLFALRHEATALLFFGQALLGMAFGVTWGPLSQALMETAPPAERDRTSALLPTLQSAGYAIGAALHGFAANTAGLASGSDAGLAKAMTVVLGLGVAMAQAAVAAGMAFRRSVA